MTRAASPAISCRRCNGIASHQRDYTMNERKLCVAATFALAVFGMTAAPALAQEARSTLSGTITDPSGSALVGAHGAHYQHRDRRSRCPPPPTNSGNIACSSSIPGTYRLTVEMAGFRTFVREGILLTLGEAATLDVPMQVGSQSETVTVAAQAPLLDAEKADRGMVVDQRNLSSLPIIARVPNLLATLTPGVIWTAPNYTSLAPFSNGAFSSFSINGSISPSAEFLLDGAPNDMIYQAAHSVAYVPPVDAVEEFKVVTGAYDAQYGRNGGGVMARGHEERHQQAAWLGVRVHEALVPRRQHFRQQLPSAAPRTTTSWMNGASRWAVRSGFRRSTTARTRRSSSWPMRSITGTRWRATRSRPCPRRRSARGDFSQTFNSAGQLNTIYDPATGQNVNGTWVRSPFPGNIIPADRIDPVGSKMANTYPLPNLIPPGPVNWQNNYFSPLYTLVLLPQHRGARGSQLQREGAGIRPLRLQQPTAERRQQQLSHRARRRSTATGTRSTTRSCWIRSPYSTRPPRSICARR